MQYGLHLITYYSSEVTGSISSVMVLKKEGLQGYFFGLDHGFLHFSQF